MSISVMDLLGVCAGRGGGGEHMQRGDKQNAFKMIF